MTNIKPGGLEIVENGWRYQRDVAHVARERSRAQMVLLNGCTPPALKEPATLPYF